MTAKKPNNQTKQEDLDTTRRVNSDEDRFDEEELGGPRAEFEASEEGGDLEDEVDTEDEGEPDEEALSREEQEVQKYSKEEPTEVLKDPNVLMELSDDPVRLYLREIGGIDLLDTDHEFWLSTRVEAAQRVDALLRQHPIARQGDSAPRNLYRALFDELTTAWGRLVEDTTRLGFDLPDLRLILSELQMLRQTWHSESPSYLRAYLDNGLWGSDKLWDGVARYAYNVFLCAYMLPGEVAEKLLEYMKRQRWAAHGAHLRALSARG